MVFLQCFFPGKLAYIRRANICVMNWVTYLGGAFEGLMSGGHVNAIIRYLISKT